MDTDPSLTTDAQDAEIIVFGQPVTRESNFIDDLLTGVTLRLAGEAELDDDDQPITETLTVGVDVDEVVAGIEAFTKAYNDVIGSIDRQFSYNEVTKTSGPLSGDFTLRTVVAGGTSARSARRRSFATREADDASRAVWRRRPV